MKSGNKFRQTGSQEFIGLSFIRVALSSNETAPDFKKSVIQKLLRPA